MGAPKGKKAPNEGGGGSPVKKTIVKNEGGGVAGGGSPAKKVIVKKEGGGAGSGAAAAAAGKAKAAKGGGGEVVRKPQKYKIGQDVLAYFIWKGYTHMYKARILRVRDEFTKQGQPTWQYYVGQPCPHMHSLHLPISLFPLFSLHPPSSPSLPPCFSLPASFFPHCLPTIHISPPLSLHHFPTHS